MSVEQLIAIAGIITAITALVVQTGRLITIAESYMVELRRTNAATEASVHTLALLTAPPTATPPQLT